MLKEIKNIPLATFLSRLGYEPARRCAYKLWYRSPLRQEHTPSFKVETALNCWYDFGIGKGGNIIDLVSELYQSTDLRHLMNCIANNYPVSSAVTIAPTVVPRHSAPSFENIWIVPLESHALVAYLQERGIPPEISKRTVNRFTTVSVARDIMPLPLPTSLVAMRYATDISKVAYLRKTSPYGAYATVRQRSVQCLKDS